MFHVDAFNCFCLFFSRVHPDGDAPRAHFEDPSPRLHVRVEAVLHSGRGQTFLWGGIHAHAQPGVPELPQSPPEYKSGRRIAKHVPDCRVCGYSYFPGETSQKSKEKETAGCSLSPIDGQTMFFFQWNCNSWYSCECCVISTQTSPSRRL